MVTQYQAIEQNWRILLENFGDAMEATRIDPELEHDARIDLLARLGTIETTLRALESCWRPIRERMPESVEEQEDRAQTTTQREYYLPLLQVLRESGGRLRAMDGRGARDKGVYARPLDGG